MSKNDLKKNFRPLTGFSDAALRALGSLGYFCPPLHPLPTPASCGHQDGRGVPDLFCFAEGRARVHRGH